MATVSLSMTPAARAARALRADRRSRGVCQQCGRPGLATATLCERCARRLRHVIATITKLAAVHVLDLGAIDDSPVDEVMAVDVASEREARREDDYRARWTA